MFAAAVALLDSRLCWLRPVYWRKIPKPGKFQEEYSQQEATLSSLAVESEQPIALFSPDGKHWKEQDGTEVPIKWVENKRVTRIVVGSLDTGELTPFSFPKGPTSSLATLYPELTHLHLWGLSLSELPQLPSGLQSLDIRNCGQLIQYHNVLSLIHI